MKIRFYLALAAAALVMTNCSQDEELVQVKQPTKGFTATIEGASRSNATETGAFSWTFGDAISVWNGYTFDKYANSEGNESTFTFTPNTDEEAGTPTDYAIYPSGMHSIAQDGTVTIDLPATYAHGSTNAPMLATITDGSTTLAFKHLGGLMRFVVKNVPEGASSFVFTTTNNILTGRYNVIDEQIYQNGEGIASSTNNNVTITFTELTAEAESMVFFVPLPVGTYGNYTVAIKGTDVDLSHTSTGVTNTIGRCTMLLMPVFTCTDTGLDKASLAEIPVSGEDVDLSGIQNVTIGTDNAGADEVLDINYTPQEGNAILNITDDSNATESQENSKGKIVINPQGSEAIESLNLNTPSLTAELGAGTYGTVEALTAKQTLIIGDGVTIEELILNGGALKIAEGATNVTIGNIVVKDELGLKSAVAVGGQVKLGDDITIEDTDGISVGDGKTVTLDLNGKTVIAQGDGFVAAAGTTLTLNATDGGSLTAGATVGNWVAVWANGGTITINGGTYHVGLDQTDSNSCIYAKNGGYITVNGGSFSHEQPTTGDNYGMPLQVNNDKGSGTIIVKGGTYTLDGGRYYEAQDRQHGAIIIAGTESTENGETTVTANTTGILTETALKSATGTATLNADICLASSMTISSDITIDLNGYYIVSQSADAFAVNSGTLTLNDNSTGETGHVVASPYDDQSGNAVWANGGNVVINGGSYKVGGDIYSDDKRNDCIYVGSNGGTIKIYDGEFQYTGDVASGDEGTNKDGNRFLVNQKNSHTQQLITIYGGKFHKFDPSNAKTDDDWMTNDVGSYLETGYKTMQTGDIYEVLQE